MSPRESAVKISALAWIVHTMVNMGVNEAWTHKI